MGSVELDQERIALFDTAEVPASFRQFLPTNKCLSVMAFSTAAAKEDQVEANIIDACGITTLAWGEKLAIKVAWRKARALCPSEGGASAAAAGASRSKMPEGLEASFREVWFKRHRFHLPGGVAGQ